MAFCPNCGVKVEDGDNFCEQCGHNLRIEEISPGVQKYDLYYGIRSTEDLSRESWLAQHLKTLIVSGVILAIVGAVGGWAIWMYVPTFTLTLVANPVEGGIVNGSGEYHRNTYVEINTTPNQCFRFTGWTGDGVDTPSSLYTDVYISGKDSRVIANFDRFCIAPCAGHQYWEYFDTEPPYDYINLENSNSASDPTWSQLKSDRDMSLYNKTRKTNNLDLVKKAQRDYPTDEKELRNYLEKEINNRTMAQLKDDEDLGLLGKLK